MQRQETRINVALGYVVGPTIWTSFFVMMAYGLWIRAWYGYMLAVVFATIGIVILVFLYRAQRLPDEDIAEIERMVRAWDEDDYPP